MDTIVTALTKFYQKLGGTPSDISVNATTSDVIDAITEVYTDKEGTHVEVTTELSEGTKVATVTTNNTEHDIYAPTPDSVSVTADLATGTKVATVTINDVDTDIYAPAAGGDIIYVPVTITGESGQNPTATLSEVSISDLYDYIVDNHKTVILRETVIDGDNPISDLPPLQHTFDYTLTKRTLYSSGGDPYDTFEFINARFDSNSILYRICTFNAYHGEGYEDYGGYLLKKSVTVS